MPAPPSNSDPCAAERDRMIEDQLRRRGVVMYRVLDAVRAVPRQLFVSHEHQHEAYADEALPSGAGQTISQPYMVGIMTQELDVQPGMRVLELGTGTGYQTAILSLLAGEKGCVYTVERVPELAAAARRRLEGMQMTNVRYFIGDGSRGWPAESWDRAGEPSFERILVTAGAPTVPEPLIKQLAAGGIMIVPVGGGKGQMLRRVSKDPSGRVAETESLSCRFVPLVGAYGWKDAE